MTICETCQLQPATVTMRLHGIPLGDVCERCEERFMESLAEQHSKTHPEEAREGLAKWRREREEPQARGGPVGVNLILSILGAGLAVIAGMQAVQGNEWFYLWAIVGGFLLGWVAYNADH